MHGPTVVFNDDSWAFFDAQLQDRGTTMHSYDTFSDGAPKPSVSLRPAPIVETVARAASRIRQFEGPRGYSLRAHIVVRYASLWLTLLLCSGLAHWAFADLPQWRHGGSMMLYSACAILLVGVIGSVLYAEAREEIVKTAKHYCLGIVALPGAALAVFMRIVAVSLNGNTSDDVFISLLRGNGLPLMYFTLVVIPVFVFTKYVFGGVRSANRSGLADEEFIATYMRQDGSQR